MFLRHTSRPEAHGGTRLTVVPTTRLARQLRRSSILSSGRRALTLPRFHSLETLGRSLLQALPGPWTLVAGPARAFLFEHALRSAQEQPGLPLARGTFEKMLSAVTVLLESGVTARQFAEEFPLLPADERARLQTLLYPFRAYEEELRGTHAVDAAGIFRHFRDEVPDQEFVSTFRAAFPDVQELFVEGFDDFAEPEIGFIHRLKLVPGLSVSIRLQSEPDNGILFGHVHEHAERFQELGFVRAGEEASPGASSSFLARRLFNRKAAGSQLDVSSGITIVESRNRWHEVNTICRLIKRIATEKPERDLSAICVAFPRPELYTDIVRERFAAFGIPCNVTDRFELSHAPLVADIIGVLEMRRHDFQRDEVLRILHSPYLSFRNEEGGEIDRGNLIEVSRRLRVSGGLQNWLRKIDAETAYRRSRQDLPEGGHNFIKEDEAVRALKNARADILRLEEFTHGLDGTFMPAEWEARTLSLLQKLQVAGRVVARGQTEEMQERDARAYAHFLKVLHSTARLLQAHPVPVRHGLGDFLDHLRRIIGHERYNLRERLQGVLVTAMEEARGMPVEVMILAGMEDDSLPGRFEPELFLSGRMRRAREQRRLQRNRHLFYQTIANWTEHLYITYPRRDSGVDLVRSSFLDALLVAAAVETLQGTDPRIATDGLYSEEEFLAWHAGRPAENGTNETVPGRLQGKAKQVERSGMIERSRRITHELGEYEGLIGGDLSPRATAALRKLGDAVFSVSDLETYGECPFRFLAGRLLGLRAPSEFLHDLSALERGFIVHDVLFEFYRRRQALHLPAVSQLSDEDFESAVREVESIAERRLERLGLSGPFWELERDYLLGDSHQEQGLFHSFLMVERARKDRMRPAYFEIAFGQPGDRPAGADPLLSTPATVRMGEVNLRGRIDRLDVGEDSFVVIDYKTGSMLPTLAQIRSGASLQLPLYLRAASELLGKGERAFEPAAGLYYRLRDPVQLQLALGSARYHDAAFVAPRGSRRVLKTQTELLAIIETAVQRANHYVTAMQNGDFPLASPERRETVCRRCAFKTICRVTTVRQERTTIRRINDTR